MLSKPTLSKSILSFDIEWSDTKGLVGYSVADLEGQAEYFSYDEHRFKYHLETLRSRKLWMHNGDYELTKIFEMTGIMLKVDLDTYLAARMVWPSEPVFSLKALAVAKCGMAPWGSAKELIEIWGDMASVPLDIVGDYCKMDAIATIKVGLEIKTNHMYLKAGDALEIEQAVIPVVVKMNHTPVTIDQQVLADSKTEITAEFIGLRWSLDAWNEQPLNLNAHRDVSRFLYEKMGIDPVANGVPKGKSGFYSTNADFLIRLQHPAAQKVMAARSLEHMIGTFIPALDKPTIQASWSQNGSITGRMACSGPNLQNVPIRSELGRQIRRAFIPREGYILLVADWNQQELRIVAGLSHCGRMLNAFGNGEDIHVLTASTIYDCGIDYINKDQRAVGKAGNFAQIYGGLAPGFDWDMYHAWFRLYPEIRVFQDQAIMQSKKNGFVRTYWGKPVWTNYAEGRSICTNYIVSGTAALVTKQGMIKANQLIESGYDATLLMQVHDELIFEVSKPEAAAFALDLKDELESIPFYPMLKVDISFGRNWLEAK